MQPWEALRQIVALLGANPEYFEREAFAVLDGLNISELAKLDVGLYSLRMAAKAIQEGKIEQQMAAN